MPCFVHDPIKLLSHSDELITDKCTTSFWFSVSGASMRMCVVRQAAAIGSLVFFVAPAAAQSPGSSGDTSSSGPINAISARALAEGQTLPAQPRLRLAQNTGGTGKTSTAPGGERKVSEEAEAAANGEISILSAAARAVKGKQAPIPVIDEETLSLYPTAAQCGECHKQIYEEWSSSQHAYASISPMFHAFEQKFQHLTQGTVGTFCVRCHQQVGTQLGESRETPLWKMSQISREGVSCITCHRVQEQYGKVNGERRVEPGKIYDPVF